MIAFINPRLGGDFSYSGYLSETHTIIAAGISYDYLYLGIFFNNGDSTFQSVVQYETVYEYPYSILSNDFDQDGDADLAVTSIYSNCVAFFENNGSEEFSQSVQPDNDYPLQPEEKVACNAGYL